MLKKLLAKLNINKKDYWEERYSEMIDESRIRSDSFHLDKFMPYFNRSKRILDFGAGLGGNIQYLSGKLDHKEFILLDQSEVSLNFAKEKLLGASDSNSNQFSYYQNLQSIDNGSIDMIMSIEVLEHITYYEEVMDEIWAKIKPEGVFLLSVPVKGIRDRHREHVNKFTVSGMFKILTKYSESVLISPRDYSKRSGRLSTAYFLVEKKEKLSESGKKMGIREC